MSQRRPWMTLSADAEVSLPGQIELELGLTSLDDIDGVFHSF